LFFSLWVQSVTTLPAVALYASDLTYVGVFPLEPFVGFAIDEVLAPAVATTISRYPGRSGTLPIGYVPAPCLPPGRTLVFLVEIFQLGWVPLACYVVAVDNRFGVPPAPVGWGQGAWGSDHWGD
jgi:hypothetical protein